MDKTIVTQGKRKRAIARAALKTGTGKVKINGTDLGVYEPKLYRLRIMEPIILSGEVGTQVDIDVAIKGGGQSSQSRCLCIGYFGKKQHEAQLKRYQDNLQASTYMILYSHPLYDRLGPWLGLFERKRPYRELAVATERHDLREADVIVFGLGRYGSGLALGLKEAGLKVLGVEFDPEVARALRRQGLPVRYGDGIASGFLESLPFKDTRWVVSTLPDTASNRDLLRGLHELHFAGEIAVVAREELDGAALKRLGAPTVLYPMRSAVDYAVETLTAIIRNNGTKS